MDMEARARWQEWLRAVAEWLGRFSSRFRVWITRHWRGQEQRRIRFWEKRRERRQRLLEPPTYEELNRSHAWGRAVWGAIVATLLGHKDDLERFGKHICPPEEIAHITRGDPHVYEPAVVRRDWIVLVPAIARTVIFVVLTFRWYRHPWQVFVFFGVFLALYANRRGLLQGNKSAFFWAAAEMGAIAYVTLAFLRPLWIGLQILLMLILLLLWFANDYVLWFYDVLIVTNLNLRRNFLDVHGLDYEYRKACGDLRSFTYNEPRIPLTTWRIWGEILRRPDLGIVQFESAVQLDKPLNNFGPITHVDTFTAQFIAIREAKMRRGPTPPPITPLP
jgi:hypothetical protein